MNTKRHILWGGIVGACVAVAFGLVLTLQFDVALEFQFLAATIPVCTILGATFGWLWSKWFGR